MTRTRNPELTRAALLEAAGRVLQAQGAAMSLDAVAREAGVSKGGLLHHFPSREALLSALALDLLARFHVQLEDAYRREVEAHGPLPGAWSRAYIAVSFTPNPQEAALYAVMKSLAVLWEVLDAWEAAQAVLSARAEADGLPPGRAHAVRLACDGLWTGQVPEAHREALREELLTWTRH